MPGQNTERVMRCRDLLADCTPLNSDCGALCGGFFVPQTRLRIITLPAPPKGVQHAQRILRPRNPLRCRFFIPVPRPRNFFRVVRP